MLAAILASITIPIHSLLLRRRPENLGLLPDGDGPTITGAQNLALSGAKTMAPVGAGLLVAALGSYGVLLWGLVAMLMLGAGAVLAVRDQPPRSYIAVPTPERPVLAEER
ncbi:MAG: hypothetical protein MUD01_13840 [Chloroflexaceae bacterium]|nr:hypothetical protein [Chloroflexaceae bacterium]